MNTENMSGEELVEVARFLLTHVVKLPGPGKEALLPGYHELSTAAKVCVRDFLVSQDCEIKFVETYVIIKNNNPKVSIVDSVVNFILPRGKR